MAISSEIEKLERRWNENPSGLMFAPLAEAYRKAGNHARALEILEHGLRVHPDYVPALIVRGRCHLETGGLEEALSAFEQALARDPVNPIALRGLAEVHERSGQPGLAVERLELLLEVDRGDAEARELLGRLRTQLSPAVGAPALADEGLDGRAALEEPQVPADQPASTAMLEELTIEPEEVLTDLLLEPAATTDADDLGVENLSIDPMAPAEAPLPSPDVRMPWEPVTGLGDLGDLTKPDVESPLLDTGEEPAPLFEAPPEEPEPMVASTVLETAPEPQPELTAEAEAPAPAPVLWTPAPLPASVEPLSFEPDETASMELELAEPAAVSEPQAMETPALPSASSEPVPPESPEAAALDWPVIESRPEASDAEAPEAAAAEPSQLVEAPVVVAEEPELIVTESMAEVFVRQGHPALALAVYRQLAERSPDSESIREAIRRLETEAAPPAEATAPEPSRTPYRAAETGGRSVGQLLRGVLQAPPPVAASTVLPPAIEPPGEPARASLEPLSLGAVFGDEPIAPSPPSPEVPAAAEPSYDEFFGAAPAAEVSSSAGARDPEGEDLRQFNDWLRGLKR